MKKETLKNTPENIKIQVDFREMDYAIHLRAIEKTALPLANQIIREFDSLNIGICNKPIFLDIVFGNCKTVEKRYLEAIEQECDRLKIKNPTVRENMRNGAIQAVDQLRAIVSKNQVDIQSIRLISIIDGKAVFSDLDKTFIRESCTLYVTTEKGKIAYDLARQAEKSLNDFMAYTKENNSVVWFFSAGQTIEQFFSFDDKNAKFELAAIDYDHLVSGINYSF